jgi:hypothetical protein
MAAIKFTKLLYGIKKDYAIVFSDPMSWSLLWSGRFLLVFHKVASWAIWSRTPKTAEDLFKSWLISWLLNAPHVRHQIFPTVPGPVRPCNNWSQPASSELDMDFAEVRKGNSMSSERSK